MSSYFSGHSKKDFLFREALGFLRRGKNLLGAFWNWMFVIEEISVIMEDLVIH